MHRGAICRCGWRPQTRTMQSCKAGPIQHESVINQQLLCPQHTSGRPLVAAQCVGVSPSLVVLATLAPALSRSVAILSSCSRHAMCSGVTLLWSPASRLTRLLIKYCAACVDMTFCVIGTGNSAASTSSMDGNHADKGILTHQCPFILTYGKGMDLQAQGACRESAGLLRWCLQGWWRVGISMAVLGACHAQYAW
eukprot:366391-Chlamydomonas_euryale.AAC.35